MPHNHSQPSSEYACSTSVAPAASLHKLCGKEVAPLPEGCWPKSPRREIPRLPRRDAVGGHVANLVRGPTHESTSRPANGDALSPSLHCIPSASATAITANGSCGRASLSSDPPGTPQTDGGGRGPGDERRVYSELSAESGGVTAAILWQPFAGGCLAELLLLNGDTTGPWERWFALFLLFRCDGQGSCGSCEAGKGGGGSGPCASRGVQQ